MAILNLQAKLLSKLVYLTNLADGLLQMALVFQFFQFTTVLVVLVLEFMVATIIPATMIFMAEVLEVMKIPHVSTTHIPVNGILAQIDVYLHFYLRSPSPYDEINPNALGSGPGNCFGNVPNNAAGGGVVHIVAHSYTAFGPVTANGVDGGGGGSIWIQAYEVNTNQDTRFEAMGANWTNGAHFGTLYLSLKVKLIFA